MYACVFNTKWREKFEYAKKILSSASFLCFPASLEARLDLWNVLIESQALHRLHDVIASDGVRLAPLAPLLGRHRHEDDQLRGAFLHALSGPDGNLETAFGKQKKRIRTQPFHTKRRFHDSL